MQKNRALIGFIVWMMLSMHPSFATGFDLGPRRIDPAANLNRGALVMATQGRFYTARDLFTSADGVASGVTVWDSQLSAALSYGLFRSVQLDFAPILLQKTHQPNRKIDSPSDFYFAAKLGLLSSGRFKTALRAETRVPFGEHHNIPLQPYSADAVGFGGAALISAHLFGKNPERGLSVDLNFGYFNHNDRDIRLTDSPADTFPAQGTQELRGGAALRLMGEQYGFYTEVLRRSYLTLPPPTAYARENSTTVSFGMLYQFNPYILVTAGVDLLSAGKSDETLYAIDGAELTPKLWQTLPNYPDWRFNVGLTFQLAKGKTAEQKEKPKLKEREKEEKKPEQIAASPKTKEKPPKKAKKQEKTTGETEKKIEITDVRELERRLRAQQEQGAETEAQRAERILRERERMEVLLAQLHERLRLEAEVKRQEAAAKAAAEVKAAEKKAAAKTEQTETSNDQTERASSDERAAEAEPAPNEGAAGASPRNDLPSEPLPEDGEPPQAAPTETETTPE